MVTFVQEWANDVYSIVWRERQPKKRDWPLALRPEKLVLGHNKHHVASDFPCLSSCNQPSRLQLRPCECFRLRRSRVASGSRPYYHDYEYSYCTDVLVIRLYRVVSPGSSAVPTGNSYSVELIQIRDPWLQILNRQFVVPPRIVMDA